MQAAQQAKADAAKQAKKDARARKFKEQQEQKRAAQKKQEALKAEQAQEQAQQAEKLDEEKRLVEVCDHIIQRIECNVVYYRGSSAFCSLTLQDRAFALSLFWLSLSGLFSGCKLSVTSYGAYNSFISEQHPIK